MRDAHRGFEVFSAEAFVCLFCVGDALMDFAEGLKGVSSCLETTAGVESPLVNTREDSFMQHRRCVMGGPTRGLTWGTRSCEDSDLKQVGVPRLQVA